MLPLITKQHNTRMSEKSALEFQCRTESFFKSSLPFLARLFNKNLTGSRKWRYVKMEHPNDNDFIRLIITTDNDCSKLKWHLSL